ncbi:non-hydrolyzing UDP-N-acetylglucosamine 2-epimerase [Brevibacillus laterosporus]|uniref:UDP-N-acetylglucosamine 2-epimerase (non-hydrolyzing) n=1 Tax=Brevibacillus laterosporus LMG 15441 TaxID=1042163 RepID=A0A075R7Z4_BRELA|nr:UDP-N-acetylglucosamine 2-epimerase (non-hydrolyzing) [Brevibacillus laterosporus]AIG28707.1 UDP-N-acetylglucosamine 2-epimerase [Brevibacillus laterosporus LMG 15441]AYK05893.1 UDP-N-acetylglucosamine 2-epimerase (non-hydrolyzing) [Brevibacillus laterosporus]MDF9410223.1 UDP-N-acetylglucosamine 2-epimerase (non-hydrolyzing) [Brevibacillus laterosporus]RJL11973.1 UDP-N-acetylglucosamine 2-epimerase (non-hydrolyzing) [Brevibacillus laterosporus]TPH19606.1 UDP-N-acetylglucosamine 2-epimerase 
MKKIKVMTVFGTRPEAIKMAPLVHELKKHKEQIESIVCVTAQHRQMLDQVLEIFQITPDMDLNIMKDRQTLIDITTRALESLDKAIKEAQPDIVLVHGDTTTTFVASLASFYNQVAIGHVEAGLRTWDKYSPFPEEMNRQLTGVMADLHFSPTEGSADNLRRENKQEQAIYITGNTAIDALQTTVKSDYQHPVLEKVAGKKMVLMTAHRRENLGDPMRRIFRAVRKLVDEHEEIAVVYPVHLNPAVQEVAQEFLGNHDRIHLIDPLDAFDFHNFARHAHLILTDSGGVQEEAPSLGVPVLVLRDTTERPEGIAAGTLKLAGTDEQQVYEMANELLTNSVAYEQMAQAANPYGDGKASERIVKAILYHFGYISDRPVPFQPSQEKLLSK